MTSSSNFRQANHPSQRNRFFPVGIGVFCLAGGLLLFTGCSGKAKRPQPGTRGQGLASPVSAAKVVQKNIPLQIRAIGNVQAYSTVQVKAQVGGQLMDVSFKEGQDVRKGDLLFKIDPRPFEIAVKQGEANLAKDTALLKNADAELGRYAGLAEKDYVTKERYDQLRVNADVLRASVGADEASLDNMRLQLEYCFIRSPVEGRTGSLMVYPGNLVKANDTTALVVIYQMSPIYVAFSVPEQNLPLIKKFMAKGPLKTEAIPNNKEGSSLGMLTFVDNGIDSSTGMIQLKATFPNTDKALWPGQFLNVVLTLMVENGAIVVPSQAVQTGQSGPFVMVVKSDSTVESRLVTVERNYEEEAVVSSGLKLGEIVVTDGLLRLVPGSTVEIKKAL
jgi:multidrug efflux system membrane fusion protein